LARNVGENVTGTDLTDNDGEVAIVADKSGAGDRTRKKGHKQRIPDKENAVTWRSEKSKVSVR
jgi:hypothetical protein